MINVMTPTMHILVFSTNIQSKEDFPAVGRALSSCSGISKWNVDLHDCDKVLRIESSDNICEEIIHSICQAGFICRELED
jgi:hypothetical protein